MLTRMAMKFAGWANAWYGDQESSHGRTRKDTEAEVDACVSFRFLMAKADVREVSSGACSSEPEGGRPTSQGEIADPTRSNTAQRSSAEGARVSVLSASRHASRSAWANRVQPSRL